MAGICHQLRTIWWNYSNLLVDSCIKDVVFVADNFTNSASIYKGPDAKFAIFYIVLKESPFIISWWPTKANIDVKGFLLYIIIAEICTNSFSQLCFSGQFTGMGIHPRLQRYIKVVLQLGTKERNIEQNTFLFHSCWKSVNYKMESLKTVYMWGSDEKDSVCLYLCIQSCSLKMFSYSFF